MTPEYVHDEEMDRPEASHVDVAGEGMPDAAAEDITVDDVTPEDAPAAPGLDALSRFLVAIVFALVIVLIGTAGSLLIFLSSLNKAPRTVVERDVARWETATRETPQDPAAWTGLVYAYAEAGRTDDALAAVRRGIKATGTSALLQAEGDVLRSAGRYAEALSAYDSAERELKQAQKQADDKLKRKGISMDPAEGTLSTVYFGRGLCKVELGDRKGAIEDLKRAVELMPRQARMHVALARVYAQDGQTEKAEAHYQEALRFVPDDEDARAGLSELKGGK